MLNRTKLLQEFQRQAPTLFADHSRSLAHVQHLWHELARQPELAYIIRALNPKIRLPAWHEQLDTTVALTPSFTHYQVLSVDGSQVYPDRHQADGYYLINIGSVLLSYQPTGASMMRDGAPSVFKARYDEHEEATIDQVNCQRSEYELYESFRLSKAACQAHDLPFACLIDGSLIFWHLESKPAELRSRALMSSLAILQQFYEHAIPVAGYISLPKSKELIHLVRYGAQHMNFSCLADDRALCSFVDADLMTLVLASHTRSILFEHTSSIVDHYPAALKPSFFYIHTGQEIARVEIPSWLADDQALLDQTTTIILDQVTKGRGYPVVLAEAHEAAVVKGADREFFFYLLEHVARQHNKHFSLSQKNLRKRSMNI